MSIYEIENKLTRLAKLYTHTRKPKDLEKINNKINELIDERTILLNKLNIKNDEY